MRSKSNRQHKRHKKLLKEAKGYRLSYSKLARRAKEALMHAGMYSYYHRRRRGSQMRKIWISRISSALEARGHKYSQFIGKLKKSGIKLNRKMLSEIAFHQPEIFDEIVEMVMGS